jgi:predicted TPR repeat methyltransferase
MEGKDYSKLTKVDHENLADFAKMDPSKIGEQYDAIAHLYEEYMEFLGYPDPEFITKSLKEVCKVPLDAKIMDMGMGTGIIAKHLIEAGYSHVDGCDASQGLLDIAKKHGQYKD